MVLAADSVDLAAVLVAIGVLADGGVAVVVAADGVPVVQVDLRAAAEIAKLQAPQAHE